MTFFSPFLAAFIPLFVAMDAIGTLPMFVGMIEGHSDQNRKKIVGQAILTAGLAGILFLFLGKIIFGFLGITVPDFKVAGGVILVVLGITDLLFEDKPEKRSSDTFGVVPLGMPLLVGPAVLTSLVMQVDLVGPIPTLLAFIANLLIAYLVFQGYGHILRVLGKGGTQAISKVASLLVTAIGVMMIRLGIMDFLHRSITNLF